MERFGAVPIDVQALLDSVVKTHTISAEDLYFKCKRSSNTPVKLELICPGESWGFKMGNDPALNIENATLFKQDIQNQLEYDNQAKMRSVASTPASNKKMSSSTAAAYDDFLGDNLTPLKRKSRHETMSSAKKVNGASTPVRFSQVAQSNGEIGIQRTPDTSKSLRTTQAMGTPFDHRKEPGTITLTLDPSSIDINATASGVPPIITANFDPKKYSFRPMYQKLSEVSEILDDQIDQYADVVLESLSLKDEDIGNPSQTTQTEMIVVGRIVCDSLDGGRPNASSLMLETSRRLGTGSRTKLDLTALPFFALFPGQLVAMKGTSSATEFKVAEILTMPHLAPSASLLSEFRQEGASVIVAAGPFTPDSNLLFEALKALRDVVQRTNPTSVVLIGPFIDLTHPLIKSGDIESDCDTLDEIFRSLIAPVIQDFPGLLIIPHVNDAISRHPCFPQEPFSRQLSGLPKTVKLLPNPALFSLDEVSYGIASNDILKHLTMAEVSRNPVEKNGLARQGSHILQQRRFYPLFPGPPSEISSIANLDIGFAGLTEFGTTLPDILITPSEMTTFAKVVNGGIIVNPGGLSKKVGSGSYAQIYILPKDVTQMKKEDSVKLEHAEDELIANEVWRRARIDIVRI